MTPTPLSVTLTMTPEVQKQLTSAGGLIDVARAYVIDSPEMAELANGEMRKVIAYKKQLQEYRKGFVAPAKQIIANAEALFDGPIGNAEEAERIYKQAILAWTTEQERLAAEARRKAEEEERRRRAEAEAAAAAARAKAEQEAAEARRRAAEAEAARRKAEAEGNARAAAAAAAERARQEQEAQNKVNAGEARANAIQLEAAAQPTPAPVIAPTSPKGFVMRDNWVAELEAGKTLDDAKKEIALAIAAGRTELLAYLDLDLAAASKGAKAQKQHFNVPGLRAVNKPVAASRAA